MRKKVLIIEDEEKIVEICRDYLEANDYEVDSASDGQTGLEKALSSHPSVVVLDLMLPGMDGIDICRRIRMEGSTPIIILTARHSEADKLAGLDTGADDYMTKPFSPRELVARVHTIIRRVELDTNNHANGEINGIRLDRGHFRAYLSWGEVALTPTEFDILAILCARPGQIFSRAELLSAVRGITFGSYERSIDSHIRNLRKKIEHDGEDPRIVTVHGFGYKFVE